MIHISLFIPGNPQPAGSKRGFVIKGKGGKHRAVVVDANAKAGDWKRQVSMQVVEYLLDIKYQFPTRQYVTLRLEFYRSRPKSHYNSKGKLKPDSIFLQPTSKPDALKLARGTEDALTGILYCDDAQVTEIISVKRYSDTPGVWIEAWIIEPNPSMPTNGRLIEKVMENGQIIHRSS